MTESLNEWIIRINAVLPKTEPVEVRDALIIVTHRAHEMESRLFSKNVKLPKNLLKKVAKPLAMLAETAHELRATAHVLDTLYDLHQQQSPGLLRATVPMPLRDERPLINDTTPSIGLIETLKENLFNFHPTSNTTNSRFINIESASIGHAILTVAYRCELSTMKEVEALITLPDEAWQTIIGAYPVVSALLPNSTRRIYVVEEAIAALRRVQLAMKQLSSSRREKSLKKNITDWKRFAQSQCPRHIATLIEALSIEAMVQNLSLIDQCAGINHLWSNHHALKSHTLLRTFAGRIVENPEPSSPSPAAPRLDSIIWDNTLTCEDNSVIKKSHRRLRKALEQFQSQSLVQDRRSAAYKHCKYSLIKLQNEKHHWTLALPAHWITSLFLHGSSWKRKLAAGSLLTYHSAIRRFIENAGFDDGVLNLPLHEFEARCQYALDALKNNDDQCTVIRFLLYCRQFDSFPGIEVDAFELSHRKGLTRAHYIPPAMFDALCLRYYPHHAHNPLPIIVFMQLCYYAGLREGEALSLQLTDIDFNTGFLYITDDKRLKSPSATRKIPLALIPSHVLKSISTLINGRRIILKSTPDKDNTLFDTYLYANQERDFIAFLKDELKDASLVTHSLRHCAANNWVYLLSMIAFQPPVEPRFYFNQHALFSAEQRARVKQSFKMCGHVLSPYFPILSWVSSKLGHASPSTTFSCYLHLLDWTSIVINAKPRTTTKAALRYWTSDSKYGFERQKQLFQSENDRSLTGIIHLGSLSHWVKHHSDVSTSYDISPTFIDNTTPIGSNLPFSVYTTELVKLHHHADDKDCNNALVTWLQSTQCTPAIFIPQANEASAWLALSLHLDTWHTEPLNSIKRIQSRYKKFHRLLSQKQNITQYRELHNALSVYQSLNLLPNTIKLMGNSHSTSWGQWGPLIQKFDAEIFYVEASGKLSAAIRPYRLSWPLWIHLELIIKQLIDYFDFLIFIQNKEH